MHVGNVLYIKNAGMSERTKDQGTGSFYHLGGRKIEIVCELQEFDES
jgi:hypothetical protein